MHWTPVSSFVNPLFFVTCSFCRCIKTAPSVIIDSLHVNKERASPLKQVSWVVYHDIHCCPHHPIITIIVRPTSGIGLYDFTALLSDHYYWPTCFALSGKYTLHHVDILNVSSTGIEFHWRKRLSVARNSTFNHRQEILARSGFAAFYAIVGNSRKLLFFLSSLHTQIV